MNQALLSRFQAEIRQHAAYSPKPKPKQEQKVQSPSPEALIEDTLLAFNAPAKVISCQVGPRVTHYNLSPQRNVNNKLTKISTIKGLENDLGLQLGSAAQVVVGAGTLALAIPNLEFKPIPISQIIETEAFNEINQGGYLPIALGLDMAGHPVVADLAEMPHLLMAGATGSGKSVCLNVAISSLLYTRGPDTLQFIMIDPKQVELIGYSSLPHLAQPVITDMRKAAKTLKWATEEMDRRYKEMSGKKKRNITAYNQWAEENDELPMTFIVIVIDELADLMIQFKENVESSIIRLAQMARAVGIHMILATQRPTVDVVTGLIKGNMPCRIAFKMKTAVGSRVILDQKGAEHLLGQGDSLYQAPNTHTLTRVQCSFISDDEIDKLVEHWSS